MAQETEAPAMELAMASCNACDLMFIASERRQTCPTCGGEAVGPYFEFVLDESGLHRKDGVIPDVVTGEEPLPEEEAAEDPLPAAAAEGETPAADWTAVEPADVLPLMVESYLRDGEATEDDLQTALTDLGAEREAAITAVGRLAAVRDLMHELAGAGLEPVTEVEVEVSPEAAPEPAPAPENGAEAP